jgi:hypothetical protein
MIFGIVALAIGLGGGLWLQNHFHPGMTNLPALPATTGIFALLYVMAQSIERVLVPVSWFGGGFLEKRDGNVKNTKASLAKARQAATVKALKASADPDLDPGAAQAAAQAAADATHAVDQYKANLTATTFGVAALLAMLVSGYTGLFLLTAVGLHVAGWLDVLVTGLAVAGGTKPLHDLISNISSSSQNKNAASTS